MNQRMTEKSGWCTHIFIMKIHAGGDPLIIEVSQINDWMVVKYGYEDLGGKGL